MFRLKLLPLNKQYRSPANPAYLRDRRGINVRVYVDLTPMERWTAIAAWAVFFAFGLAAFTKWFDGRPDEKDWWIFPSALAFAIIGGGLLIWGRRIASSNIYLVAPGEAFPVIDPFRLEEPTTTTADAKTSVTRKYSTDDYEFHFVVRETEPNAAQRLEAYAEPGTAQTMQYEPIETSLPDLMKENATFYPAAARVSAALVEGTQRRWDIWPVVRLVLGRILYQRPPTADFNRTIEDQTKPLPQKGNHAYFAYKLHLLPVAYWFLMNAVALVLPRAFQTAEKAVVVSLSSLPVIWALWVIFFHGRAIARWKRWLSACGHRPLGKLPLYLHIPHNDARHRWEELDENDFRAYVDEYVIDTEKMFNISVGSFSVTSFAVFQLLG